MNDINSRGRIFCTLCTTFIPVLETPVHYVTLTYAYPKSIPNTPNPTEHNHVFFPYGVLPCQVTPTVDGTLICVGMHEST